MSDDEKMYVKKLTEFVIIFYAKFWFTTSLPCSAPREDLEFISKLDEYRKIDSKFFWAVSSSFYLHLWYLTEQMIVLALFDPQLESSVKEAMARKLHQTDRVPISTGKPVFPTIAPGARWNLQDLVGAQSWLLFDLFDMTGPQDWLLAPCSNWHLSPCFRKLEEFASSLVVVNDIAERGCHMATEFMNKVHNEEERQALVQRVEDFRKKIPTLNKKDLKLI